MMTSNLSIFKTTLATALTGAFVLVSGLHQPAQGTIEIQQESPASETLSIASNFTLPENGNNRPLVTQGGGVREGSAEDWGFGEEFPTDEEAVDLETGTSSTDSELPEGTDFIPQVVEEDETLDQ